MTRNEWLWCVLAGVIGGITISYLFAVHFAAWLFDTLLKLSVP